MPKDKVPNIEDYVAINEFEDLCEEIHGLPPKKDIDFSINLIPRCYNPKLHHTCLPGIRPTHIPSLPKLC
jgi:hypothetical protein